MVDLVTAYQAVFAAFERIQANKKPGTIDLCQLIAADVHKLKGHRGSFSKIAEELKVLESSWIAAFEDWSTSAQCSDFPQLHAFAEKATQEAATGKFIASR